MPTGPIIWSTPTFAVNNCFKLLKIATIISPVDVGPNIIKYTSIPNKILTIAPAATIAILFGILASEKDPSVFFLSSSPSILQYPPSGIIRIEYLVSFPCLFQIVGPNPIENSFTFTLHAFATSKCPASCIVIKNPNKNIIFIADINIVKFIPP